MPALDIYHDAMKNALVKDGWTISHDPFHLRFLYLAVRDITFNSLFEEPVGQLLIADENLNLIVFEAQNEVIVRWIP